MSNYIAIKQTMEIMRFPLKGKSFKTFFGVVLARYEIKTFLSKILVSDKLI